MAVETRIVRRDETGLLDRVAPDVFDDPIDPRWWAEFLADPRHHIAVAIDEGRIVGFASGVHYVHPDKPPELWVNEVGVTPSHRERGLGRRVVEALFARARELGCGQAWVATERSNGPARRLYAALGGREDDDTIIVTFALGEGSGEG